MILTIPAGSILDRYDRRAIAAVVLALSAISVVIFPFSKGLLEVLFVLTSLALTNAFLIPAGNALMADMVPRERRGMAMAMLGGELLLINFRRA